MSRLVLADKQEETYKAALDMLLSFVTFPNLGLVTCDFEEGLQNAVRYWIHRQGNQNVKILGCKFHFTQCLVRKMVELYGKRLSRTRREMLALFCTFPFLTREKINGVIQEFHKRKHDCEKFILYFERFWMRNFDSWNVSKYSDYIRARATNNAMESFNRQVNDLFVRNCPRIERLIEGLKKIHEQKRILVETEPCRDELVAYTPVIAELNHRLRELWAQYDLLESTTE